MLGKRKSSKRRTSSRIGIARAIYNESPLMILMKPLVHEVGYRRKITKKYKDTAKKFFDNGCHRDKSYYVSMELSNSMQNLEIWM